MKNILTLSVAILAAATTSMAQQSKKFLQPQSSQQPTHTAIMNMLLGRQQDNLASKTTTMKQRIIGESTWDNTGSAPAIIDSVAFGYTSDYRGSSFNYNMMAYYYTYPSLNNFVLEYVASNPDRIDVKADSSYHWTDDGSGYALADKQKFVYNTANKVFDYIGYDYSSTPADGERYIHTYDAQGRLSRRLNLVDNGGAWDTSAREMFTYNAAGKIILDSLEEYNGVNIWTPNASIRYTYDVSGNPTNITLLGDPGTGSYIPVITYDNTFYSNNNLKTSAFGINFSGTGIEPYYLDSFGYNSGISYPVSLLEYTWNGAAWDPSYKQTRHVNSLGQPDTLTASTWNGAGWDPYNKNVYTYNSYSNPQTVNTYNAGSTTPDYAGKYYYEVYNDRTAVGNPPVVMQDIKAYPNPATGTLNLNWSNVTAGTPVTVRIAAMNGQLVHSESFRWNQQVQQLSVGHLQPGIYAVSVTTQNGEQVFRQTIVKQ